MTGGTVWILWRDEDKKAMFATNSQSKFDEFFAANYVEVDRCLMSDGRTRVKATSRLTTKTQWYVLKTHTCDDVEADSDGVA